VGAAFRYHEYHRQTEDGSQTISNEQYGETYHSVHGAFTEAQHVFLMGSGVAQRLKSGHATRVLEIGFGLGLNTLLTADLAKTNNAPLAYHSYEHQQPRLGRITGTRSSLQKTAAEQLSNQQSSYELFRVGNFKSTPCTLWSRKYWRVRSRKVWR